MEINTKTLPLIILDRDGVINFDSDDYIKSPDEWRAIPGSLQAIASLNKAGYKVVIVTNQSGVGRGYYSLETLDKIHEKLKNELAEHGGKIDEIYFCPHTPDDLCECRKPNSTLFLNAANDFNIDIRNAIYIADKMSDIKAGRKIGCKIFLVLTGYGKETLANNSQLDDVIIVNDLQEAVQKILENQINPIN